MSIASYLQALIRDKATLVSNLKKKGISSASTEETFTTLVAKVDNIDQGIDTSDATATASDIMSGKTAYASGSKITGTHVDLDTSDANATASDMLNNKTAYVDGSKITGNIPSKAAQTYTPTTTDQQIASGQYLSGNQTIKGDANLAPSNIKAGTTIFGVTGNSNVMDTTEPASTTASASNVQAGMSAYVNGVRIVGECVSMEGNEYTPSATDQVIQGPKILQGNKTMTIKGDADLTAQNIKAGVNIFNVEGSFTSDATATSSDMKSGVTAYVNGEKITGDAYTRTSQVNAVADGLVNGRSHWLRAGFYSGIAFEAEPNLAAENIKKDVTIYGVTGTYDPFVYELPFNTIYATSADNVYSGLGDASMLLVEDDEWRSLNEIQAYSEELAGTHWWQPKWVYKDSGLNYYGIYLDSPVSSDYWNINNKKLSVAGKWPMELKGTHLFIRFRAEAMSHGNSINLKFDLVSADNFTNFKTKFSNNQIDYTVNRGFNPAYSGDLQLFEFTDITPGKYFLVVTAPLGNNNSGGCTGFTIDSIGVLNA